MFSVKKSRKNRMEGSAISSSKERDQTAPVESSLTGTTPGFRHPGRRHRGCFSLTEQDEHNGQEKKTQREGRNPGD